MADPRQAERERQALAYLRQELGDRAPAAITVVASFGERPLEDEGPMTLFAFDLPPVGGDCPPYAGSAGNRGTPVDGGSTEAAGAPLRHYVVAGETQPNYFPAYGLDPDDAYSLHIGTRFMLEMQIGLADPADEPPQAREAVYAAVRQVAAGVSAAGGTAVPAVPGATDAAAEDVSLAALFRVQGALYGVYRLRVAGEPVYFLGADSPPGFYRLTHLPPQVVLRLHLGKLIRAERGEPA